MALKERPDLQFIIALASEQISTKTNQLIEKHQVKHLLGKSLLYPMRALIIQL